MIKRLASLTSTFVLALGIAAFAGSALAGNGNGNNGNGNGNATAAAPPAATDSQSSAPGNSANAPGHQKNGGGSAIQTSAAGVKPSNATVQAKDSHAAAGSNQTKLYGNGQTAGQIAMQNGASSADMLHGPGNSQPHKMALCPRGHEVDVHALKAKGQQKKCGVAGATTPATSHVTSNVTPTHAAAVSAAGAGPTAQGGVLGAIQAAPQSQHAGGILGAIEAAGHGILPFTGFPLGIAVLVALGLIVLGLALRRMARQTV